MTVFTCEASALAKVLRHVNEISTDTKETIALLKNVRIVVKGKSATFTRSNFDGAITRTIPVEAETPGTFTVEAAKFAQVVSTFANGAQAKLSVGAGWATLTCGRSKVRLATLDAKDFPDLLFDAGIASLEIGEDFIKGLSRVAFAAGNDAVKVIFCGVSLRWVDGKVEMAATDGNRLAMVRVDGVELPDAVLPNNAVSLMLKLGAEADKITMDISETRVRWSFGDTVVTHKLLDGKFPQYAALIRGADASPNVATVDSAHMTNALSRMAMLATDKERTALLTFAPEKLTMESRGAGDQGNDEIPCDMIGDGLDIAVRSQFLRESLAALDAETVEFGMIGPRDPIMVRSPLRPDALIVAMPMLS